MLVGCVPKDDPCDTLTVPGVLNEKTGVSYIASDNFTNVETIDIPNLNTMAARSGDTDALHLDVPAAGFVAFETDTDAAAQVQIDLAQRQVLDAIEPETKVRVAYRNRSVLQFVWLA